MFNKNKKNEEVKTEEAVETKIPEKETKKKRPLKKFFKILFSIIFILLVCVIALGIYLGVNIVSSENYNGNESVEKIATENKSLTEVSSYIMYDAIKDTETTKEVDITLDEENMNYLLHAASKKINLGGVEVHNLYMYYDESNPGTYSIYMPMKWLFFTTCLSGTAKISVDGEMVDIYISNLSLGKLSTDNWLLKNIVLRYLNNEAVEKMFSSFGMDADVKISTPNIDVKTTTTSISNMIFNKSNAEAIDLVKILYGNLDENSKITYEFDDKIGLKCNLNDVLVGQTYEASIEGSLSTPKNNMNFLIKNKVATENNVSVVWTYLLNGYSMLTDDEKKIIDKLDFSTIGLNDSTAVEAYSGVVDRTYTYQISLGYGLDFKPLFSYDVYDDTLNALIKKSDIVGSTMAFMDNDKSSFDYIIVEDLYLEFKTDTLYINILLDINGSETTVCAKFDYVSGENELTCKLSSISLGNLTLNQDDNDEIIKFLADKVNLEVLTFNKDTATATINLDSLFDQSFKSFIEQFNLTVTYTLNNGKITLSLSV